MKRLALVFALALFAFPAVAQATPLPGPNGKIVFTSGRDSGATVLSDMTAQIWLLNGPGGGATRLTSALFDGSHHRHPTWSPDRTKVAYARGPAGFAGPWDIVVHDVELGSSVAITTGATSEDRPSWSPDGTRIAYSKEVSAANWSVVTKAADGTGGETTVATAVENTASGQFTRPTWSPNSQTIYYGRVTTGTDHDIYRSPANGSNTTGTAVVSGVTNDYQPAISADGAQMCFTHQVANKNVQVATIAGAGAQDLVNTADDDYECTWSPDGTKIAFVRGPFGAGEILMRNSDSTGSVDPVTNVATRFDGNPEWTMNPRPVCQDRAASVARNGIVEIPLACTDDGGGVSEEIVTNPANGVISAITNDESVLYTPNVDFEGSDQFTFRASDGNSDSDPATITVKVGGAAGVAGAAPVIGKVSLSRKTWRRGSALPTFSRTGKGTKISFTLSKAARTTLTFAKAAKGRRVGGKCRKPTAGNRSAKRCTRYVKKGSRSFDGKQGKNTVSFAGRLTAHKRLAFGSYKVTVTARDADGRAAVPKSAKFRIVAR